MRQRLSPRKLAAFTSFLIFVANKFACLPNSILDAIGLRFVKIFRKDELAIALFCHLSIDARETRAFLSRGD
jgi:hypothetical protein